MLCRQLDWLISGQLLSLNAGAPCNLEVSPVNTNEGCCMLEVPEVPAVVSLEVRKRLHGTGTSCPLVEVVVELVLVALEFNEMTAKSILPEPELRITSEMVPRF